MCDSVSDCSGTDHLNFVMFLTCLIFCCRLLGLMLFQMLGEDLERIPADVKTGGLQERRSRY